MENLILEVRKKKELSGLPNSIIEKALVLNKQDVKRTRAFLRKYFGVFLTNRVVKPKNILDSKSVLESHISSKKRDYDLLYGGIKRLLGKNNLSAVLDFGSGVNGFSIDFLKKYFNFKYYSGFESSRQIVDLTNSFFEARNLSPIFKTFWIDLFNEGEIENYLGKFSSPRLIFLFQVIDALEIFERDYSKKLMSLILDNMDQEDYLVVSIPTESLSGRTKFSVRRDWLVNFIRKTFRVLSDFELNGERFFILGKN